MSVLLSNWSKHVRTVPSSYVLPQEKRPGNLISAPVCKSIPVIDLGQLGRLDRAGVLQQIMNACQDFGIFQVINHGVSEELMEDTMSLFKEFFDMPAEELAEYCSEDRTKSFRLYTSVEVRKLSMRVLDLICEGLGIEMGYFGNEISKVQGLLVNHYPPCPDPSLVLGVRGHCDPNLLTLVQQEVHGLQIFKDGQWAGVEPLPHAFVINICNQLEVVALWKAQQSYLRRSLAKTQLSVAIPRYIKGQKVTCTSRAPLTTPTLGSRHVEDMMASYQPGLRGMVISNGKLKSAQHRVVTNTSVARTSLGTFIDPCMECVIEPAKAIVSESYPPLFKSYQYKEFIEIYMDKAYRRSTAVELLKLQA
ncbi:hypothetical protein Acr_23g0019280 [Actinidia rufa]|uniref:Fe2OG dioxygenase domain-containing protein n=1 Tax=Actinidia rufa TaxID=165716 RepID=A0A7J0GRZ6_9ERIC|nr:hypothetical protein Acr_23g0019280 [Actinidia rufa]